MSTTTARFSDSAKTMPTKVLPVRKEKEEAPKKTKASAERKPFIVKRYKAPAIVERNPDIGFPYQFTPQFLSGKMHQIHPIKNFPDGYISLTAEGEAESLDDKGHVDWTTYDKVGKQFRSNPNFKTKHAKTIQKNAVNNVLKQLYIDHADKDAEITVLDGHDLGTSMRFIQDGTVDRHRITVYNDEKNFKQKVTVLLDQQPNIVVEDVMLSLIKRENIPEHLFLDFCNTIDNNLWSMSLSCKRKLLPFVNGVVWLTCSRRSGKKHSNQSIDRIRAILHEFVQQAYPVYDYKFNKVLEVHYGSIYSVIYLTGNAHVDTDFSKYQAMYEDEVSRGSARCEAGVKRPLFHCIPIPADYSTQDDADYSSEDDYISEDDDHDYKPESESETDDNDSTEDEVVGDYLPESESDEADTEMETAAAQSDDGEDAFYNEKKATQQTPVPPKYYRLDDEKGYVRFRFPAVSNMAKPLYVYSPDFLAAPYSRPFQGQVSAKKFEAWSLLKQDQYVKDNLKWLEG